MTETTRSILDAALALSDPERDELIEAMLSCCPPPPGWVESSDEELHAELQRRAQECRDGTDSGIPWSEVKTMLLSEVDARPDH